MDWLLQAQAWATIAAAIGTTLTFLALIWYTIETQRLRKAAEKQNERSITPIVMLEGARDIPVAEGANMPAFQAVIHNIGTGPAFNISIEPLKGPNAHIRFEHTTALAAGDRQPVWMMVTEDDRQVASRAYEQIYRMFHGNQLVTGAKGVVSYSDVNGKRYRTTLVHLYDKLSRDITTQFVGMENITPG